MKRVALLLTVLVFAAGCGASQLPFKPVAGQEAVPVSADYQLTQDRLYVYVESDGYRVDSAVLTLADGKQLTSPDIRRPAVNMSSGSGVGVGAQVGVGAGPLNRASGVGVGIGAGVGSGAQNSQTVLVFDAAEAGGGPWRLSMQIASLPVVTINLPAPGSVGK